MKGILIKDVYTLKKTIALYLIVTMVFCAFDSGNLSFVALFYATMLPINLITMDERARFDRLAVMLPLRGVACVLDKYLVAYAGLGVTALMMVVRALTAGKGTAFMAGILLSLSLCLFVHAVLLPLIFRFGIERGRMIYVASIVVLAALLGALGQLIEVQEPVRIQTVGLIAFAGALALNVGSIFLSKRVYIGRMTA